MGSLDYKRQLRPGLGGGEEQPYNADVNCVPLHKGKFDINVMVLGAHRSARRSRLRLVLFSVRWSALGGGKDIAGDRRGYGRRQRLSSLAFSKGINMQTLCTYFPRGLLSTVSYLGNGDKKARRFPGRGPSRGSAQSAVADFGSGLTGAILGLFPYVPRFDQQ